MECCISDTSWQEDDVVHALTARWRSVSTVLASGGNQGTLHFLTASGRRKAPDIVVYCAGAVVLLEAKARAAALFAGMDSDVAIVLKLLRHRMRRDDFLDKVVRLLISMRIAVPVRPTLVCGVLSGSVFSEAQLANADGLVCIEAPPGGRVRVAARQDLLPRACAATLA